MTRCCSTTPPTPAPPPPPCVPSPRLGRQMMRAARATFPSAELEHLATARPPGRPPAHRPGTRRPRRRAHPAGRRLCRRVRDHRRPGHRSGAPAEPRPARRLGLLARLGPKPTTSQQPRSTPGPRHDRGLDALPSASSPLLDITAEQHAAWTAGSSPPDHHPNPPLRTSCHAPRPLRPSPPVTPSAEATRPTAAAALSASAWPAPSAPARPRPSPRSAAPCTTRWCIAAVTNDIYTREDAEYLLREAVLPPSASPPSRPAPARTPRSATTFPPTSKPSNTSR